MSLWETRLDRNLHERSKNAEVMQPIKPLSFLIKAFLKIRVFNFVLRPGSGWSLPDQSRPSMGVPASSGRTISNEVSKTRQLEEWRSRSMMDFIVKNPSKRANWDDTGSIWRSVPRLTLTFENLKVRACNLA
ncbi:hypothetical protein ABVF61_11095 [Roseibium sp. HPY-6]|uniref:hypothetical protein n=1 Tax=Roseibium sp. HPY-6 TaxID=3229852 RepID=UPI003390466A